MGCDIHMYCEIKKEIDGTEKWYCADKFYLNEYYGEDEYEPQYYVDSIYSGRNYSLFGVLADVRNYDGNVPMDEPRGLPDDVSETIKEASDRWGDDGHSHSWFTARELFDYQEENSSTLHQGMISAEQDEELKKGIKPTTWCQWTNSPGYVKRAWVEDGCVLDNLIDAVKKRMAEKFWIWDFLDEEKKAERFNQEADNFRIVFWFDN